MTDAKSESFFEPLSAMDRQFLVMEDANVHMHVSGFTLYETEPLRCESGGMDFALFRRAIESVLPRIPRYRQTLAFTPIEGHPAWVDAQEFDIDHHLRHLSLPPPGTEAQLKQMVGWIVSQPVDHARPLWEMWVVEGVDEGRHFAVVTKMHHCMIDGGAGANLMQLLLRTKPSTKIADVEPWEPRPVPGRAELAAWEVRRRMGAPLRTLGALRELGAGEGNLLDSLGERVSAFGELLQNVLPASPTPVNGPLGPHRRVDWLHMPLEDMASLRRELGCTLNDLVLSLVCGALRRYLERRDVELEGLTFRVSIPVNVRLESEKEEMNNRISTWIIPLPLAEPDPLAQLAAISERTEELKHSNQAIAVEMMMAVAEEMPALLSLNATAMNGQISTVVTNVPGPPIPLYMLGCRALNMQPLVPLLRGVGLGVAVLSYDGTLFWGFQGDYDLVPDLERFGDDVREAWIALEKRARE
jgi:WS/DGAT/MGAT family acyltransferase